MAVRSISKVAFIGAGMHEAVPTAKQRCILMYIELQAGGQIILNNVGTCVCTA